MAENGGANSPAFIPPRNSVTDNDPQIIRVAMDAVQWGFRRSQDPRETMMPGQGVKHIPNGG